MKLGVRNIAAKAVDALRLLLFLIPILFLLSCSHSSNDLSENKTFQKVFTASEINDLQRLFDFFNESICSSTSQDLDKCYEAFLTKTKAGVDTTTGEFWIDVPFDKQREFYNSIDSSVFNEIWWLGKAYHPNGGDTTQYIYLNPEGKYLEFLNAVGENDEVISNYTLRIENFAGEIPPSLITGVLIGYKNFNIYDIRVKFILAIHYLTLNDRMYRDEEYIDPN